METIEGNYIKEFDATVVKRINDQGIELTQSAFYPEGGGQPSDSGLITWPGNECRVVQVVKKNVVLHHLDRPAPSEGTVIHGLLD